jgi:3-oxo-5-alpha-steroid 4-dehydrogenase 1
MNQPLLYSILLIASFVLAAVVFTALMFVNAPYGRHIQSGWGPTLSNRIGWLVMESPSALVFALFFILGTAPTTLTSFFFLAMWEAHYIHRAFIYPFQIADGRKRMPLVVMLMAFGFNFGNASINGWYLFALSGGYPSSWLRDPRFIVGVILFISGYAINRQSDRILRKLRQPGELGYKIPRGGLFRWVSCPNYLGEIIEWGGWAIATWSLPGLAFAVWTFANLAPRARAHHRWYREHFEEYPKNRKALLPGMW